MLYIIDLLQTEQCTSLSSHSQKFEVVCLPMTPVPILLEISGQNFSFFLICINIIAHVGLCMFVLGLLWAKEKRL
jgi:hypothetical protein